MTIPEATRRLEPMTARGARKVVQKLINNDNRRQTLGAGGLCLCRTGMLGEEMLTVVDA